MKVYIGSTDKIYTGLADKDAYHDIISSVCGQIYDGIGEGSGRESRIFNYYFKTLVDDYDVSSTTENGEFVVTGFGIAEYSGIELLTNCIWRIASIERKDIGTKDKNIDYEYLRGANWSDICKLCGALTNIVKKKDGKTEPWTEEQKNAANERIANAKARAEQLAKEKAEKEAAEKKAKEEEKEKALEAKYVELGMDKVVPDAKDIKRAEDAWNKYDNEWTYFNKGLLPQLAKITDKEKAKRRIVAFCNQVPKDCRYKYIKEFEKLVG